MELYQFQNNSSSNPIKYLNNVRINWVPVIRTSITHRNFTAAYGNLLPPCSETPAGTNYPILTAGLLKIDLDEC